MGYSKLDFECVDLICCILLNNMHISSHPKVPSLVMAGHTVGGKKVCMKNSTTLFLDWSTPRKGYCAWKKKSLTFLYTIGELLLVVGSRSLVFAHWKSAFARWLLVVGTWSLVVGRWLLVIGCR